MCCHHWQQKPQYKIEPSFYNTMKAACASNSCQSMHHCVNADRPNLGLFVVVTQVFQFDPSEHRLLVEQIKQCKV